MSIEINSIVVDYPWIMFVWFLMLAFWLGFHKGWQDRIMASGVGFDPMGKYDPDKIPVYQIKNKWYRMYHEKFGLNYKEKFFLAGTMLVSLTDLWHVVGLLRFFGVVLLTMFLIGPIALVMYPVRAFSFHLIYE